jgi:hypothetical protein
MFAYRIILADIPNSKFNLTRIDGRGDVIGNMMPVPLSYDRTMSIAEMSGDVEHDPYQEFKIQWPRHAYVIEKMEPDCKDRWIAAFFLSRVGEPEMNILWESAGIIEQHPGLKTGGISIDFQGAISGGKVSTGDAMDRGKKIGPRKGAFKL